MRNEPFIKVHRKVNIVKCWHNKLCIVICAAAVVAAAAVAGPAAAAAHA